MQKLKYKKLQIIKSFENQYKSTNQDRFWKKFKTEQYSQGIKGPINCVSSNRNINNLIIYCQGRQIHILDTIKHETTRSIVNSTQTITALCLRQDSSVLASGDQSGCIEIQDTKQRFHLRTFKNSKKRINTIEYIHNNLYSGGDDSILRYFDVSSNQLIHSYSNAHIDYIKSIKIMSNNHILSGGAQGLIKLFDFRIHQENKLQFQHKLSIQDIDLMKCQFNFIVCGGNKLSIWDIRRSKTSLFESINNKNIITSIKVLCQNGRFITGSLDGYIKIYKSDTFELTYQQKILNNINGITSFDITRNCKCFGIGTENGKFILKGRKIINQIESDDLDKNQEIQNEIINWLHKNEDKKIKLNSIYFYRGVYEKNNQFDIKKQNKEKKKKLNSYDIMMKKFQFKQALLTALNRKNMIFFVILIDQLQQRGALKRTIQTLDQYQLNNLLQMISPLIKDPRYCKSVIVILNIIMQHRLDLKQKNHQCNKGLEIIHNQLNKEISVIQQLFQIEGMLEFIINAS